jgi:hypothetical protein
MRNQTKEKKDMKADVYQKVTDKIIADLEKGKLSWLSIGIQSGPLIGVQKGPLCRDVSWPEAA